MGFPSLVVIAGDIADQGREADYSEAGNFIRWLQDLLEPGVGVVCVPGLRDRTPSQHRPRRTTGLTPRESEADGPEASRLRRVCPHYARFQHEVSFSVSSNLGRAAQFGNVTDAGDWTATVRTASMSIGFLGASGVDCWSGPGRETTADPSDLAQRLGFLLQSCDLVVTVQNQTATELVRRALDEQEQGRDRVLFLEALNQGAARVVKAEGSSGPLVRLPVFPLVPHPESSPEPGYLWMRAARKGRGVGVDLWWRRFEGSSETLVSRVDGRDGPRSLFATQGLARIRRIGALRVADYLDRLVARWGRIPVIGLGAADPVKIANPSPADVRLERIFVPPRVFVAEGEGIAPVGGDEGRSSVLGVEKALSLADHQGRWGVVFSGCAGIGKTTALRHLLLRAADDARRARNDFPRALPLPVYIEARELRAKYVTRGGLPRAAAAALSEMGFGALAKDIDWAREPILFLVDGLDDARIDRSVGELCAWLGDELALLERSRCACTCRAAPLLPDVDRPLLHATVEGFDDTQTGEFVDNWLSLLRERGGEPEAGRDTAELERQLREARRGVHSDQRHITQVPLLLSQLCLIFSRKGQLPGHRAELFEECVQLLVNDWPGISGRGRELRPRDTRRILRSIAWTMQERGSTRIPREHLLPTVRAAHRSSRGTGTDPGALLDGLVRDVGLLSVGGDEEIAFLHRAFQEYLAARDAVVGRKEAELAERLGRDGWNDVIALAAGMDEFDTYLLSEVIGAGTVARHFDALARLIDELPQMDLGPLERLAAGGGDRGERRAAERLVRLARGDDPLGSPLDPPEAGDLPFVPVESSSSAVGRWLDREIGLAFQWVESDPPEQSQGRGASHPAWLVDPSTGFFIATFPVTNKLYARYLEDEEDAREPACWTRRGFERNPQPVVGVAYAEAVRFCRWLGRAMRLDRRWRVALPTGQQWALAAYGSDGRPFPWGSQEPTTETAVFHRQGPASVGSCPAGASATGCLDMAGNVWEWCQTRRTRGGNRQRMVRGGGWTNRVVVPRGHERAVAHAPEWWRRDNIGFRVVCVRRG